MNSVRSAVVAFLVRGPRALRRHLARRPPRDPAGRGSGRVRRRGPRAARRADRLDRGQLLQAGRTSEKLDDASLKGIVDSLDDPFSHYLTPKEATQFNESVSGEFEGVGMSVEEDQRGLRVLARLRRLAGQEGRHQAGRPDHRGRRQVDRGRQQRRRHRRIKGQAGTTVELERASRPATTTRASSRSSARGSRCRSRRAGSSSGTARSSASSSCTGFSSGAHGAAAARDRQAAEAGRRGHRARPARQRRRPADRGRARLEHLHRGRQDRLDARAARAPSAARGARATRSTRTSPWSCSSTAAARAPRRS